jgi:acetylornithine deacetylase/succinyl-diaminopimelate desuccinylase-like protein
MVNAGHARNALPGAAKANVNCRILPGHSQEEVRQKLISIFGDPKLTVSYVNDAGQTVGLGSSKTSMEPPPVREDVFGPLRKVTEEMWPGVPVVPVMSTGASDSIFTAGAGLPSYGISGMGVDFDDDRAHGRDERIRVEAFYQGVEFRYLYMKALTR